MAAARGAPQRRRGRIVHALVLALGLTPLVVLVARALLGALGANPVETITHVTGEWALRLLVATLAVTPARRLLGWSWLAPERRTLGLLAFGYASLHFATFLVLDLELDPSLLVEEILERPYVTAGFASLVLMLPLAATSTRAAMRRLGRRWTRLHRLVWPAAAAALLHFAWIQKADLLEPAIYAAVVAALLAMRVVGARSRGELPATPRPGRG